MECNVGGLASGIFGNCGDYAKQMFLPARIDRGGEGVEGGEGGGCGVLGLQFPAECPRRGQLWVGDVVVGGVHPGAGNVI